MDAQRHEHRCQNCGTVWSHSDMLAADIEAHKCPKCGAAEWRKFAGLLPPSARANVVWRVYRLPGSREFWLIDSGSGTKIFKVRKIAWAVPSRTVEVGPEQNPRAWIAAAGMLYIDGDKAAIK